MSVIPLKRVVVEPDEVSEITGDVPIPTGKPSRYPLAQLKPGESFSCPANRRPSLRTMICKLRRRHPQSDFTIRNEPDQNRIRVWRVR